MPTPHCWPPRTRRAWAPTPPRSIRGRNDIATLLLEKGVELDIFAACMAGAKERVIELIGEDPALVSAYSHDGWTPLHLACFFGQPGVAEALIARGADVRAAARNRCKTRLFTRRPRDETRTRCGRCWSTART